MNDVKTPCTGSRRTPVNLQPTLWRKNQVSKIWSSPDPINWSLCLDTTAFCGLLKMPTFILGCFTASLSWSISGQSRSQGQEHVKVSDWYRRWSSHLHTKIEPVDCISTCWPQGVHCLRELHGSDITGSSLFCIHSPKASRTYCLVLILENKGSFYGRTTQ